MTHHCDRCAQRKNITRRAFCVATKDANRFHVCWWCWAAAVKAGYEAELVIDDYFAGCEIRTLTDEEKARAERIVG